MKAYKVVAENDFGDHSSHFPRDKKSFISLRGFDLTVEYKLHEKAFPEIGKLFIFRNLERAKNYVSKIENEQTFIILEGEADNCRRIFRVCCHMCRYSDFWKAKKNNKKPKNYVVTGRAPEGSYVCDSFTPTKIVSTWKSGNEI